MSGPVEMKKEIWKRGPDVTCLLYEAKDGGPVEDCTKPDINLCRSIPTQL